VIWNVNRIKSIFKKYLSDPISDITLKIKENKPLPSIVVEELAYLTEQIVELGKIKTQEKIKEEKTKIMQSIGASIAHELRTPLRSMISGVSGIEKFLPALLNGYDLAKKANLVTTVIGPQQIELLHKVLSNLKTEGTSANMVVDMLLMKIRGTITAVSDAKELSISECLDEALQRYGFQEAERNLIIYDTVSDFWFEGNKLLVVHVLFNLLKNALYYIASGQQGQIYISFECGKNENILHFKDTGKGIAKEVLPHIFDRFYSKTEGGTGIGLSFCKMAMEWMGGDITCQSIEGEYTEFVLHFPVHK
jgi:two-component system CAI-1 autoinducer sensor kinase/phosphatase CqsS